MGSGASRPSKGELKKKTDAAFSAADTNRDGRLSVEELVACLGWKRSRVEHLLKAFDANSDGSIDKDELKAGFEEVIRAMDAPASFSAKGVTPPVESSEGTKDPNGSPVHRSKPQGAPKASSDATSGKVDATEISAAPLPETDDMYKAPETIFNELKERSGLTLPPVRLLRSSWLIKRAEKLKACTTVEERRALALPRRQDIETQHPEAFYAVEEVMALKRGAEFAGRPMSVLAVSHCWETAAHPDPEGATLVMLCDAMERAMSKGVTNGEYTWEKIPREMAVFYDYGSLYQKCPRTGEPRTAMENAAFKAALSRMQVWYAHQLTTCFFMTEPPAGSTALRYTERGWPTFEYQVSMLAKTWTSSGWPQLFDVGRGVDKLFVRPPPLSTEALLELLQTKCFTNGADRELVAMLYKKTATNTIQCAANLKFNSSGWGPEELRFFVQQWFPICDKLEAISFASNPIGPEGAKILCDSLRDGFCPNAEFLNFFNNKIGGEGLEHVMQFLKERERDKSKILPKLNRVRVGKNKLSSEQQQALKELCSELGLKCET